jgi:DNA-directed RNA polymerase
MMPPDPAAPAFWKRQARRWKRLRDWLAAAFDGRVSRRHAFQACWQISKQILGDIISYPFKRDKKQ